MISDCGVLGSEPLEKVCMEQEGHCRARCCPLCQTFKIVSKQNHAALRLTYDDVNLQEPPESQW